MNMHSRIILRFAPAVLTGLTLLLPPCRAAESAPPVELREESVLLPTYLAAPPDPNPRFYQGRTYQGARATFYPYPVQDRLTDTKADVSYKAVRLENKFIEISVLPELGGRIFTARDKSNGYDFFYRQRVIKPALIGMLGAWISGGVEWNVPHHHRATSFMPVDYTSVTNSDGSKTVWVGETELRHGLKWLVGLTLHPDRSFIEMSMKVFNGTALAHPILFWINPAVHANEKYQVIFPPGTEWAVQHSKPEFASWPVARQVYGGNDYTRGVDISWWKNHASPVSFFAWNCEEDWFGGYDHGKEAGVLQWSDHHVAPGKKFFEWGNGPQGEMWSDVLSDEDGPYLELMAGAWSDNQPDYSWLQPGQSREWKHWWYPIRNMGGVKHANRDAAVNLELANGSARLAINATRELPGAQVRLQSGGRSLFEKSVTISPDQPFSCEVPLDDQAEIEQLRVSLWDAFGDEVLAYQPKKPAGDSMPKPVERPRPPKDYATADELYYTGQRIEQLYSPAFEAAPYYEEILRRDPGDYRANTSLGILLCRQWRWDEAASRLSNAVARATANYIRPKDGEAFYYLGLALQAQGQPDAAFDVFYKAAWSQGWEAPAYFALAQIQCARTNYQEAIDFVDRSLAASGNNIKSLNLKATLLRKSGRLLDAQEGALKTLALDPLNFHALNELSFAQREMGLISEALRTRERLDSLIRGEVQSHLDVSLEYAGQGCWTEAIQVLQRPMKQEGARPMITYALAYCAERSGRLEEASQWYTLASKLSADFCFPGRFEEVTILKAALEHNPRDARAAYYLGNALYDRQPAAATKAWEKSRDLDPAFALAHRNLGLAYAQHEQDVSKAVASLERAVDLNPEDPRLLYELDVQYEAVGAELGKRLDRLSKRQEAVELRDDTTTRLIVLLTAAGQHEEAMRLLRTRHFHNWEGSGELHDIYVNACLRRGVARLQAGKARDALADFEAALEYPRNQEVGRSRRDRRTAEISYYIGTALETLGESEKAAAAYQTAANAPERGASEGRYFKALALQKTGKRDEASPMFERLVQQGLADLKGTSDDVDYFAKFGEKRADRLRLAQAQYLTGLGFLGQGKLDEANARFAEALKLNPCHVGALLAKP